MPIQLKDLREKQRTIEIEFFDEKGELTYTLGMLDDSLLTRVQKAQQEGNDNQLNQMLRDALLSWDVIGENGQPLGFSDEELSLLPIPFKAAVLTQVWRDWGNLMASGGTSDAGSRSKGK